MNIRYAQVMPRALRTRFEGAYYHVFNRGVEKRAIFKDDRDRKTFLKLLAEAVHKFDLRLFVYCLMGNHFHLFLQTPRANLDRAMQSLQGQYAHYVNSRYDRVGALFGGRYKSPLVKFDDYAMTLLRYIHRNPLDGALVGRLEDYPWSSYPSYVGKLPRWPWLETKSMLQLFHPDLGLALEPFQKFHETLPSEEEKKKLKRSGHLL